MADSFAKCRSAWLTGLFLLNKYQYYRILQNNITIYELVPLPGNIKYLVNSGRRYMTLQIETFHDPI